MAITYAKYSTILFGRIFDIFILHEAEAAIGRDVS
jgi:hypothetical protein